MQEWLNNLYRETQSMKDGRIEGRGLGAAFMQNFVDEDALNTSAQQTANQRVATQGGEDLGDLNLTSNASTLDVEGAIIRKRRERDKTRRDEDYNRSMEIPRAQLAESAAQNAITNKRLDNQMEMALLDRADSKEQAAMQLEYQKLRDRKADMQYNERMERLDRQDRRAMMQNLAAGLASLGAAFAL